LKDSAIQSWTERFI